MADLQEQFKSALVYVLECVIEGRYGAGDEFDLKMAREDLEEVLAELEDEN